MFMRCMMAGTGRASLNLTQNRLTMLAPLGVRGFRSDFKNPYMHDPQPMSQEERDEQVALPVWDRTFDHKRYM